MNPVFDRTAFNLCTVPVPKGYPQSQTHVGVAQYHDRVYLVSSPFPNPRRGLLKGYFYAGVHRLFGPQFMPIIDGEYYENPCLYAGKEVGDKLVCEFYQIANNPLMQTPFPVYGYPSFNSDPDIFIENGRVSIINRVIYRTSEFKNGRYDYFVKIYRLFGEIVNDCFLFEGTELIRESNETCASPSHIFFNGRYILTYLNTNSYNDGRTFDGLFMVESNDLLGIKEEKRVRKISVESSQGFLPWHMSLFSYKSKLYAVVACVEPGVDHCCKQMLGLFDDDLSELTIFSRPLTTLNSYRGSAYVNEKNEFILYSTTVNERFKGGLSVDGREIIVTKMLFDELLEKFQ